MSKQFSSHIAPTTVRADDTGFDVHDYNAVLSRLSLTDCVADKGLALLHKMAPRPRDAVGLGRACRGASEAVQAACVFLEQPTEEVTKTCSQLLALWQRVQTELDTTGTAEGRSARGRRLAEHPAWRMCIALGAPGARESVLVLGGLLLLMAAHRARPVPGAKAEIVYRHAVTSDLTLEQLRPLLESDVDAAQTEWPWLSAIQRQWPAICNALMQGGAPAPTAPRFHQRARGQLFARAHYASPARRAGVPTARELSEGQFAQACAQVARWIDEDDWRGAFGFLAGTSGLTVDLLPGMPLVEAVGAAWTGCLDLDAGTQKFDVEFLANQAAAMPREWTTIPACFVIEKPLTVRLAQTMRARRERFPGALTLGSLYPEASPLAGHMEMIPSGAEIGCSWARWVNSSGIYMRRAGMDNLLACICSGDFGHAPGSKLYYAVISHTEIWQEAAKFFMQNGLGEAVDEPNGRVGFGSRVVPTDEVLRQAVAWHRARVEALHPTRRGRSVDQLLNYHNQYAALVGFELALLLGLREAAEYDLWSDIDETQDAWVDVLDKTVPGPNGALPVPLSARAKAAIGLYRIHCRAVADRLGGLGKAGTAAHRWLLSVCRREHVGLLCKILSVDSVRRAGSSDAIGVLPNDLTLVRDVGRKWLENALRYAGSRTGDIDGALRHDVIGQSRFCSVSDFILSEWAMRTACAIDSIAGPVLGAAIPGLARR